MFCSLKYDVIVYSLGLQKGQRIFLPLSRYMYLCNIYGEREGGHNEQLIKV